MFGGLASGIEPALSLKGGRMIAVKRRWIMARGMLLVLIAVALTTGLRGENRKEETVRPVKLADKPELLYGIYGNGLEKPVGVALDERGYVYVADAGSHQIKVFSPGGRPVMAFGKPGTEPGQLNYPYGLAFTPEGELLVSDPANERVSIYSRKGHFLKTLVSGGNDLGLIRPGGLTVKGDVIYISDLWGHQIVVVDGQGKLVRRIGRPGSGGGELRYPQSVAIDDQGRLWVADAGNNRIQVFDKEGNFLFMIGGENSPVSFGLLRGIAIDNLQRVLIADSINSTIRVFDPEGKELFSFGGYGEEETQFIYPIGLAVGEDGKIYVADRGNQRVQVWGYRR
ncbi:6-bladed beta-propeller [Calderihabitans maritimus]|uniref:NHL repeat containing protein n=1 Tax=Calderihabitans maritimus TaxID=1246530 RepID=A0A1Z5HWE2_9FIRM|nr:6-bladed beta-propeller [Calderihabitans maritimus]GAW93590.1 NHL repeat containing protein [Calderihabitans maritimus]